MTDLVVVDVGNSRMKWGRCDRRQVAETAALPLDQPAEWQRCFDRWSGRQRRWIVTGVHPEAAQRLVRWLRQAGVDPVWLEHPHQLPLTVAVDRPEHVGMDRLLNAVAANSRRVPGQGALVVDAGSAITVDLIDRDGVFRGGAILPGLRLMSRALNQYTALLPIVDTIPPEPEVPGTSTPSAIATGIHAAAVGGVRFLIERFTGIAGPVSVFVTGGDRELLKSAAPDAVVWPEMTLEGIRLAAICR